MKSPEEVELSSHLKKKKKEFVIPNYVLSTRTVGYTGERWGLACVVAEVT